MKPTRSSQLLALGTCQVRCFSRSSALQGGNRVFDAVRTPPTFHDYLRQCSANNTLLLGIFTTSACTPCRTITPLLRSITESRAPQAGDSFASLALTEIELDSPDTSNGTMMELGMLYGVSSLPTVMGFGGRRAERITDRLVDLKMLCDRGRMERWVDEQMRKGDQHPSSGGIGKAVFDKFFS